MRVLAVALAAACAATRADDGIPPDTVGAVKKATVFVRVEGPTWGGTGSGFVVAADKDGVLVATNYHVLADPKRDRKAPPRPAELAAALKRPAVTAVFDGGTKTELSARAEAVAADPDTDLAILRVTGLKAPPAPIDLAGPAKLSETMPVYTFGYPFGQALALGKGAPAVTVGKGSVSSLRLDGDGELALVQLDGALNPGNSGGPVVDAKGRLVGVAVARFKDGQGIGFAVPAAELGKVLKGRVGEFAVTARGGDGGKLTVRVEVAVVDPSAATRGVTLHHLVVPPGGARPAPGEPLAKHPGAKKAALKVDGWVAAGELASVPAEGDLYLQAVPDGERAAAGMSRVRSYPLAAPKAVAVAPKVVPKAVVPAGRGPRIQGGGGAPEFRDHAPDGGLLVGFDLGLGKFLNTDVVVAARPVYRVGDKDVAGAQHGTDTSRPVKVLAKPGYAVGAVSVRTGILLDGLLVTFMKVVDGKLDPKDSYDGEWVGDPRPGRSVRLGDGTPVVGVLGKANERGVVGLGLVYPDTMKQDGPWPAGRPTAILGGGDAEFRDGAPAGGLLVGLEVGLVKFFDKEVVRAVRPVYRVGDKDSTGAQFGDPADRVVRLVAKPGYAVGAVRVTTGLGADGLSVSFMKVTDGRLDPKDNYESEWVGPAGRETKLGGDGTPVVGVAGKANAKHMTGLGLLLKDEKR